MLRMSGMGGLQLGPIRWQGKANGKPVPLVESTLPLQQVDTRQTTQVLNMLRQFLHAFHMGSAH